MVRLTVDPMSTDGKGTVAQIGDADPNNYFYFGGLTAEDMTPEEYAKNVPLDDIISEMKSALDDFRNSDELIDEYNLYYALLRCVA